MKNVVIFQFVLFLLVGCQTISSAQIEPIALPNGNQGWIVDCSLYGMSSCFKSAGSKCMNGYLIHERITSENTDSKIPVDELPAAQEGVVASDYSPPSYRVKDRYMVISCKE